MIIKPEHGKISRWGVLGLVLLFALLAANEFNTWFSDVMLGMVSGNPVSLGGVGAVTIVVVFLAIGFYCTQVQPRCVDFLVDVQSEMAKVSWSSKKDLFNSTIVVIVLCVLFGSYVYVVDNGVARLMDIIRNI